MASVTLRITGLNERQLRDVLVAHHLEHKNISQPQHIATSYARQHDAGLVGAIVRVEGPECYTVLTMPLSPESASLVADAVDRKCEERIK